jgi:hypothetical protein
MSIVPSEDGRDLIISFRVSYIWKGPNFMRVMEAITCKDEECCGVEFKKGKRYVVFTGKREGQYFRISKCSLTRTRDSGIIESLNEIRSPVTPQ